VVYIWERWHFSEITKNLVLPLKGAINNRIYYDILLYRRRHAQRTELGTSQTVHTSPYDVADLRPSFLLFFAFLEGRMSPTDGSTIIILSQSYLASQRQKCT
jgi:hypothetical protein